MHKIKFSTGYRVGVVRVGYGQVQHCEGRFRSGLWLMLSLVNAHHAFAT